jgi:VWFA-related protein
MLVLVSDFELFMKVSFVHLCLALTLVACFHLAVAAQTPTPTPERPVKVVTEEISLNVMARDRYGKFVARLKPDDLLIVEEGVPQTITSMRRVPANVLLLLDTGGDLSYAKTTPMTRITSKILIDNLSRDDSVAVMQYNNKVEVLSEWTKDREAVFDSLNKRLFSGKQSRFSEGLNRAVELFGSRALENRHLVLISDGLDSVSDESATELAFRNIMAANITVHVISYTQLEQQRAAKALERIRFGKGDTKPRVPEHIFDSLVRSLAIKEEARRYVRSMNSSERIVVVTLDNQRIRFVRNKHAAWGESQKNMQLLANDTGGLFHAPEGIETMWKFAAEIANAVGSQYVITYSPTTQIDSTGMQSRKVRVGTHCLGVEIQSRQKLVLH